MSVSLSGYYKRTCGHAWSRFIERSSWAPRGIILLTISTLGGAYFGRMQWSEVWGSIGGGFAAMATACVFLYLWRLVFAPAEIDEEKSRAIADLEANLQSALGNVMSVDSRLTVLRHKPGYPAKPSGWLRQIREDLQKAGVGSGERERPKHQDQVWLRVDESFEPSVLEIECNERIYSALGCFPMRDSDETIVVGEPLVHMDRIVVLGDGDDRPFPVGRQIQLTILSDSQISIRRVSVARPRQS